MTKQIIIIIVVILLLAGGGYMLMKSGSPSAIPDANNIGRTSKNDSIIGVETIGQLSKIGSLTIDDTIFINPIFKELRSFSREIELKAVGKDNPFSPTGATGYVITSATSTNSIGTITTATSSITKTSTTTSPATSTKSTIKKTP